jgi:hypothetical protein
MFFLKKLYFGDRDGLHFTNLNTTVTSQTFIGMNRDGLSVLKLIYIDRTDLYAFFIAYAFFRVNFNLKHNKYSILTLVRLKILYGFI